MVDDFEPTLTAIVGMLEHAGYAADGVRNSVLGREAIRGTAYDVIVSDYEMSGGSGLDLLVLAKHVVPHTPVILYSGSSAAKYLKASLERGAFAFLEKPFAMDLLLQRIEEALRSRAGGSDQP